MNDIIAERLFQAREGGPVVARIYAPERMGQSSEWSCKVAISGLDVPYEETVIGVDSFQAVYLGLRLICTQIEKVASTLRFLDGEEGDPCTPLIYPWSYSPSLKAKMYRLIDEKIKEELNAVDDKKV